VSFEASPDTVLKAIHDKANSTPPLQRDITSQDVSRSGSRTSQVKAIGHFRFRLCDRRSLGESRLIVPTEQTDDLTNTPYHRQDFLKHKKVTAGVMPISNPKRRK